MTAPDPFVETPKKALAERGPSIHDAERYFGAAGAAGASVQVL
jgi:hypothetical protein